MAVEKLANLIHQAAAAGFDKAVITGGEPLMHPEKQALLEMLADLRGEVQPMQIALRTNLAYKLEQALVRQMFSAVDEIVISLDGGRENHEKQRGEGTYRRTVENIRTLVKQKTQQDVLLDEKYPPAARIRIAATLPFPMIAGPQGDAVRALCEDLDLPVRFKPILPLGRGKELGLSPAFYSSLEDGVESLADVAQPAATCGLGMNLYVGADGACYPCYALLGKRHALGNALRDGMAYVLKKNDGYRQVTVDTNRGCRACALRYLCGGYCRAWGLGDDPNAPPPDCAALYTRAAHILRTALEILEADNNLWQAAGLPGINENLT